MKRVLLTPLDWGLGHATRCIPIIRELRLRGWEVLLAGSGDALALLRIEFPDLPFFSLPPYAPRYPLYGSMAFRIARQLPRFVRVISEEHKAVKKIINDQKIDVIISDNRYGCWSRKIPSVFVTHQTNIIMPERLGILQFGVSRINRHLMQRFKICWIPDMPGNQSLAGDLASFKNFPGRTGARHIGFLSRFERRDNGDEKFKFDVLAVFSGPEPQRTVLENIVVPQLKQSGVDYRVVRGLPSSNDGQDPRTLNFLPSHELQKLIESSAVIIARSGYSTVMDMHALGKKIIFVPTPGQTEQEYLAKSLMEKGIAFSMPQTEFDLANALRKSADFSGFIPAKTNRLLTEAVDELETL